MGKSVINNDPFAYKPEYNQQVSGAKVVSPPNSKAGENDPFAYRPEYNADVKKKVGGTESEIGITEPVPTQSELQSKKENATSFLISDINKNDFFSKLAAQTDQYFPHTTPQRVNEQAAQVTQQEVFRNPASLQRYTDQRIKDINEELANIQREQNKLYENIAIGADVAGKFTRSVKDQKRYDELAQQAIEKEQYKRQLKNNVAELAADQIISQMDLSTGMDFGKIGRQVSSIADPEQEAIFKMAEKGGKTLPGIRQEQMNYTGLQAVKSFLSRNPDIPNYDQVVKNINDLESDFDERNPQTTALRVREKIGAQLYKEGKSSFFGFGYSPTTLKEAADNPETALTNSERKIFNEVVLPTERRLVGTDIPTSGFTRSFYNAIEKGGIGMGKTLGDVTGLRDESDQAADVLTQEQAGARYRPAGESPTAQGQLAYLNAKEKTGKLSETEQQQKKELENYTYVRNGWSKFKDGVGDLTGQVAMIALATKGLGGVGKALMASGAEGGLLGGMTRSAIGQALSNETVGLFTTSYLNAYDNYKQQAIQLMPKEDQAAERNAYATVMSSVEALSERIFPDTKILSAFTKGVAPTIKDITSRFISREITQQVAKEETQKALTAGLKSFGKEYLKSTGQEATEEAVVDIAQGIADSTFGGQPFDIVKTGQQALNTFLTTALYSPIVAGMAGRGAMRQQSSQNAFMKSAITDMAANPAQYLQSVEDLQLDGTITQQQANEKIQLIKSANKYLQEIPPSRTVTTKTGEGKESQQIDQNKPFDYPETSSYLLHRLNEGILTEQIENTTDEVVKSKLQKDLKRSQEIRKGLFDGSIGVTPDLKEVTDNEEKADELGIFNTGQVQPDELIGTPFEQVGSNAPRGTIIKENKYIKDAVDQGLQEMRQESLSGKSKDVRSLSQRIYEKLAQVTFPESSPENEGKLQKLLEDVFTKRGYSEAELRNMSESELTDASRRLYETIRSEMVVQGLSSETTQRESSKISDDAGGNDISEVGNKREAKNKAISGNDRKELSENQAKEASDFTNELLAEDIIPAGYKDMAKSNPVEFWKFVAQQAQNVDANWQSLNETDAPLSEQAAIDAFGETIVDYAKELFPVQSKINQDEGQKQETIPASEEGGGEEISIPENATEGNESKGDEALTEQGAEPIAEAPLELTEEDIQKPLEATRAKKVSGALRDFATKIQKADITGAGGASAQSDITKVPREVMAFAINRVADAIDAGEAVVNAIQKGVDYIREQGHAMEDDSFKRYTTDLIIGKKPRVRVTIEPKVKKEKAQEETKGDSAQSDQSKEEIKTQEDFEKELEKALELGDLLSDQIDKSENELSPNSSNEKILKENDTILNTLNRIAKKYPKYKGFIKDLISSSDKKSLEVKTTIWNADKKAERAFYNSKSDKVYFDGDFENRPKNILHEIIHAMTAFKMPESYSNVYIGDNYRRNINYYRNKSINTNTNKQVAKLIDLYIKSINSLGLSEEYFGKDGIANNQNKKHLFQDKEYASFYGFYNIHEFLAEAFTNPEFQDKLESIKIDGRSAWERFVNFVGNLLGLTSSNILDEVIKVGYKIISSKRPKVHIGYDKFYANIISENRDEIIKDVISRTNVSVTNKQLFDSIKKITGLEDNHINGLIDEVRGKDTSQPGTKQSEKAGPDKKPLPPKESPKPPAAEIKPEDEGNIDDYEMTTSGEVNRFLSGDTWEDVFGEAPEGDQNYATQKLSDMLQDGKNMIAIAQQKWGGDVMLYAKPLFQLIQAMSNDKAMSNKKAVLLATFLGELQEAKKRSPERFDAISQIEKAVFAYYQNYMNVRGKEIVAGRLLRLYRDKYIGDIYADRILEKEQVKAKKAIQELEQDKQIDDKIASEETKPITEEEKKKEDKAAKKKTEAAKKAQSKKKKMTNEEAKQRADSKVREIEEKMGKDGRGGLINRIKEAIKKLNCK